MKNRIFFTIVFAGVAIIQSTAQRNEISAPEAKNRTPWYAVKPAKTIMVARRRALHGHVAKNSSPWDHLIASYRLSFRERRSPGGPLPKGQYPFQDDGFNKGNDQFTATMPAQSEMQAILSFYADIYETYFGRYFERVKTTVYPNNQSLDKQQ